MDRVNEYPAIIKRLLTERERIALTSLPLGLEVSCFFDDKTQHYALLSLGWMKSSRVSSATLLLRIKDDKIWIEEDKTDAPIAFDLVEEGVSSENIVLGFYSPEDRSYTDYAVS